MSEFVYASFGMGGLFMILAIIFLIFKEKACGLISGYNFKTKEERKNYDEIRLSRDNVFFWLVCSLIFIIGGVGCILISDFWFGAALGIWLIYFLKDVRLNDKAFDKYKKTY